MNVRSGEVRNLWARRGKAKPVLCFAGLTDDWRQAAAPFLTPEGELAGAVRAAVRAVTGIQTKLSSTGGTSGGRFIIDICPPVLQLGPVSASIHKRDERVEIVALKSIYRQALGRLLLPA